MTNEDLKTKIDKLLSDNASLVKQNKEFKELAERNGSEVAKWKHDYLRCLEEIQALKNSIEILKVKVK